MVEKRTGIYGICFQDGKLLCGVAQELDVCDEGTWRPPHVVADSGYEHRTCAYYATSTKIGRCGPEADGSLGACSNFASRCDDPDAYVSRDPTCFITHDGGRGGGGGGGGNGDGDGDGNGAFDGDKQQREVVWDILPFGGKKSASFRRWTTYGKCVPPGMNDHRCVWSPDDCTEGEFYVRNDPECTADKIELGACLDGYGYCTVTKENCQNPSVPYYTHQDMLDTFNANCYLAALPAIRTPKAPTVSPVDAAVASTSAPVATTATATFQLDVDDFISESQLESEESLTTSSSTESSTTGNGLSEAMTIGITVGCALVAGMALGMAMSHRQKRERRKKQKKPVRSVVAGEVIIADDEELSVAGY
mmetsp:Transcript_33295/g.61340  ORF Transcript_33295/g.61340 Transcript_33295/m.61340 type:complete len:363 (+) Transcript_33295:61-1149(+)|eukprot:CAMPEP_0196134768 /NCGR_PEP_ID=MMETSP0910-20130528/3592_1 /TAXON_ID=49265 /ORGANISM="Thalassiosira rotula, Strain GSO102" /LENGTH=362 /DNA_ID=CAMNT_0041394773 /DNA_START=61 /DNA_END=1149 /DNA_ORIENTATION=-